MKTYASHKKYQLWAMSFIIFLLLAAFPVAVTAISISAIVQDTIDTVTEFGPSAIGQTFEVNEPIEVTGIDVYLGSNDEANLMTLALYQGTFDDTDQPTGGGSVVATANVTLDSVASAWVNFNLTASIESGLPYYFIVTSEAGKSLEHGYASTDEYPNGWFLGEYNVTGELQDYPDLDLSFKIYYLDDSQDEPVLPGRHEVITLLVNPQDVSGIRTENLNYYLAMPQIWQSNVKNITVWLETEIYDLAQASQTVQLAPGQTLNKIYNIRLMAKITYTDGTTQILEVDNADIKRNIPVWIPIDEFGSAGELGIVYIDSEGHTATLTSTKVTVDGKNYLKIENNHFSEYGVVSMAAAAPAAQTTYIIQSGDTLSTIAAKLSVSVSDLVRLNAISNPDLIYTGKVLVIR